LWLFGLGHGWGGHESLLVPAEPAPRRHRSHWRGGALLRFHVGLEDVDDLRKDLARGLAALRRAAA
jgi:cystathionine beta-lyase